MSVTKRCGAYRPYKQKSTVGETSGNTNSGKLCNCRTVPVKLTSLHPAYKYLWISVVCLGLNPCSPAPHVRFNFRGQYRMSEVRNLNFYLAELAAVGLSQAVYSQAPCNTRIYEAA